MNLDLGIVEEGIRTGSSSATTQESVSSESRFASLLARHLGQDAKMRQESEPVDSRKSENRRDNDQTSEIPRDNRDAPKVDRDNHSENGAAQKTTAATETESSGGVTDQNPLMTSLESWQSPSWLVTTADQAGTVATLPGSSGTAEMPVTIQSRLAGAIAARFSDQNGVQNLSLKIDPGNLGRVEVHLQAKGDHLSVQITAGNREAETALRENLRDLTDAIQEKTGRFQNVEVKVDLKSGDRPDQQDADKDGRQPGDKEQPGHGQEFQDNPDTEQGSSGENTETEPELRAQGD